MNFQDALQSGKPFRRLIFADSSDWNFLAPNGTILFSQSNNEGHYEPTIFTKADYLATDYELYER